MYGESDGISPSGLETAGSRTLSRMIGKLQWLWIGAGVFGKKWQKNMIES